MKHVTTAVFIFCAVGLLLPQSAGAQIGLSDTTDYQVPDSTGFTIENPMEMVASQYEILGVSVVGAQTVRESFVPSTAGLEVGSQITIPGDDIPEAIKRLYRTGLFSDIKIIKKRTTTDGVYLEVRVQEQPRLDEYSLEGIKRSQRKDLKERLSLLSGFAVTESARQQAVQTIKRFYSNKGYWNTQVEIEETERDTVRNRVKLEFNIDPGERLEIKDITFFGNKNFSDKKLIKTLDAIKQDAWWKIFSKKLFKEEDYEEARQNLVDFYNKNGFRDFRITGDSVFVYNYRGDKEGIAVHMWVEEGPQYRVRNITWEGNTVYTDEELAQTLGFEKGDVFNQQKFQEKLQFSQDNSDISSLYQNIGYLFFQVQPNIEVVQGDSLDIHLQIYEDEKATIRQVEFNGNTKTHDNVVRRTLRTVPGMTYSRSAIMRTIRELGNLGYFRPEKIKPNLNPDPEERTVDISYKLSESASTDNFEFSGGFGGRNIGLILSARVNFNNFSIQNIFERSSWSPLPSGDGQKLSLGVQVTGRGYQSYSFSFQEPWLMGYPTSFGVSASYDLLNYRGSSRRDELFSSSVSIGRRLKWPDDYFSQRTVVNYQLYDVQGRSFLPEGTSNILSIKEVIERNSLDNMISPNRGSKISISGEIAPPLPGFAQYFKFLTDYQHHMPVVGKLVLSNSVHYGYIGYLGQGQRSNFKRFYLGGTPMQQRQSFIYDNIDLRGFPGGTDGVISPYVDGEAVGGRMYSKYTFELRYPAVNNEQVRLIPYAFMDAGNSYRNFDTFNPFSVKRATGLGMRIFMPILGLVDLSYGYRLDGIPGSDSVNAGEWEFLFNIGAPF